MSKPKLNKRSLELLVDNCDKFTDFYKDVYLLIGELDDPENLFEAYKRIERISMIATAALSDLFEYFEELLTK